MALAKKVKAAAARATMSDQDVRAMLTKDHDAALALAKQICESRSATTRTSLFKKLKPALVAHSRAEEKAVYDRLIKTKDKDAKGIGNEGYVEHSLLDALLERMSKGSSVSDAWQAQAKVLHELLSHHVDEEQSEMYADLGEQFSREQLIGMGERFQAEKKSQPSAKRARRSVPI